MTIRVYPYDKTEEKALLDFLESRHYRYQSSDENAIDAEFIAEYNKELAEAEAEIDAGEYLSHDEVKKSLAERRKRISGN